MTVFSGVLSGLLLWQLLGLLTVLSSKSGKFNPFLDPSLNDISSHTLDQCFCDVNAVNVVLVSSCFMFDLHTAEGSGGCVLL